MVFKVHRKEQIYFALMTLVSVICYAGFVACALLNVELFKVIAGYAAVITAFYACISIFLVGYLRGNAVKIHERQFPDLYAMLTSHAQRLAFKQVPDMYLLQGDGMLNAFATRWAGRNFIVVYSSVLELAYQEGSDAVSFIIGHELGHLKRNHLGFIKTLLTWPASWIPFLGSAYSRACEYTCDNIGQSLCPEGAERGVLLLAAGKQLYKRVRSEELIISRQTDAGFALWFAEIFATHPHLVNRVINLRQRDQYDLSKESLFVSPKIEIRETVQEQ